jgi:cell division protein FtsI (penicillin-binding protein 3)
MMEGVVLYGTGKPAQLNGYSSGGKTGTAQKIDPVTHLYSKTMHIGSFAGIAPVNNPVISVAVVIDSPTKGPSYYGTAVAAPVFAEVAQQVLEYLGVPHDTEIHAPRVANAEPQVAEDDEQDHTAEVNALFAAANELPVDDPLRNGSSAAAATAEPASPENSQAPSQAPSQAASQAALPPTRSVTATKAKTGSAALSATASSQPVKLPAAPPQTATAIKIVDSKQLRVPSLVGLPMRQVISTAAAAGLEVQITGSGTAREQAPAAGTMVATGTQVVVRCAR